MYFITTKRMLEVCFFQHTPTFIIEPFFVTRISRGRLRQSIFSHSAQKISVWTHLGVSGQRFLFLSILPFS